MITKDDIKKLKDNLRRGDQKEIARLSSISQVTVGCFFNGKEDLIAEDTAASIVKSAAGIIKQRNKLLEKSENLIKDL